MADLLVEEFSDCESITYEAPKTTNPENGQFYLTAPLHDPSSAAGPSSSSSAPLDIRDIGVAINTRLRRTATLHAPLRGSGTAFYDVDDSGTYDPEIERAEAQAEIQRKRARARARKNEVTNLASFSEEDDDELRESSVSRPSSEAGPSTKKAKKRVKVEHSTRYALLYPFFLHRTDSLLENTRPRLPRNDIARKRMNKKKLQFAPANSLLASPAALENVLVDSKRRTLDRVHDAGIRESIAHSSTCLCRMPPQQNHQRS